MVGDDVGLTDDNMTYVTNLSMIKYKFKSIINKLPVKTYDTVGKDIYRIHMNEIFSLTY